MIASYQTLMQMKPVSPFHYRTQYKGMTFGLGPAGYDIRIAQTIMLWPGAFRLASSLEHFNMPAELLGIVHDKSTWARRGLAVQNTVIEPGWRGYLTLELSNHGDKALEIEKLMPIAQILFHILDEPTTRVYDGIYQDQEEGPTPARFRE